MEFWKSVDRKGIPRDIKVIISDKLLNHNGVIISNFTIDDVAHMYDFYDIHNSKKLCIVDRSGNNKTFRVCIDNVFIPVMIDNLCFITGGNTPYFNDKNSMLQGTITDTDDKGNASIVFAMSLYNPVFIDIDYKALTCTIKINTCNKLTSDIISSIVNTNN